MPSEVKRVNYQCLQCQALDTGKFFPNEVPFLMINCWNCKSGSGLQLAEMAQQRKGMVSAVAAIQLRVPPPPPHEDEIVNVEKIH